MSRRGEQPVGFVIEDAVDFLSRLPARRAGPSVVALADVDPGRRPALLAVVRESEPPRVLRIDEESTLDATLTIAHAVRALGIEVLWVRTGEMGTAAYLTLRQMLERCDLIAVNVVPLDPADRSVALRRLYVHRVALWLWEALRRARTDLRAADLDEPEPIPGATE